MLCINSLRLVRVFIVLLVCVVFIYNLGFSELSSTLLKYVHAKKRNELYDTINRKIPISRTPQKETTQNLKARTSSESNMSNIKGLYILYEGIDDYFNNRNLDSSQNKPIDLYCEDKTFYGYSAVLVNLHQNEATRYNMSSVLAVTGWERKPKSKTFCCFLLKNGSTICRQPLEKHERYPSVELYAVQYKCPIYVPEIERVTICHNSASSNVLNSPINIVQTIHFINISYPFTVDENEHDNIAVCSKTAYKDPNPELLIEWFELQRFLRVNKVVAYTNNLNRNASDVLQYYSSIGLLSIIGELGIPEKEISNSAFGNATLETFTTDELAVLDCQARLYNYKYVAVIDKDEFLLPSVLDDKYSLLKSLNSYFDDGSAGLQLKTTFHFTTWEKSDPSRDLVIGQYINATFPFIDCGKSIIMPSRVRLGTLRIHDFKPLNGLRKFFIDPKELVLHHVRKCRRYFVSINPSKLPEVERRAMYFDNATDFACHGLRRYYQANLFNLTQYIKDNVTHVRKQLLQRQLNRQ